jgi:hypothetical protein
MVGRKLEGLSVKLKNARLDLYCRSYGDQKSSFHLKAVRAAQKTSLNNFLKNKRKLCHVR